MPWLGIRDARAHHAGVIHNTAQHVTALGLENSSARLLPAGTVCLSRTASVGYAVVMGRPMATSQDFVNWICGPDLEPRFLQWVFVAEGDGLRSFGEGSTHTTIYFPEVLAFHVCLPPIDVQRRIVAKLDVLVAQSRAAREQLEAVPDLVETYRQSVLAAAFRGDLSADWRQKNPDVEPASKLLKRIRVERRNAWEAAELAKMTAKGKPPKDDKWKSKYAEPEPVDTTGLPELPPTWCWARMDQLVDGENDIFAGPFGTLFKAKDFRPSGVPIIFLRHVARGRYLTRKPGFMDEGVWRERFRECSVVGGELLVTKLGEPPGVAAIYPTGIGPAMVTPDVIAMRVAPQRAVTLFLMHYLNSDAARRVAFGLAFGSTRLRLTLPIFRGLAVPLPPLAEQRVIVGVVDAVLARAEQAGEASVGLDQAFDDLQGALLAKAFSGELVRG